jgi:hypothetical protein
VTGCAAVFKGSKQDVRFVADPERSDVRVDGRYVGATPVTGHFDRDRGHNVAISKPGYKPASVQLRKQSDTPWFFWDIATCVIPVTLCIPVVVDAISGAWYSFDEEYAVKLDPEAPSAAPALASPPAALPSPSPVSATLPQAPPPPDSAAPVGQSDK